MLADRESRFDPALDVLMTRRPVVVEHDERVAVAASLASASRVRHLPVVAAGRLVGLVALGDLLTGDDTRPVFDVMRTAPVIAATTTTLSSACARMLERRVSCLPVLDQGALVGIFTATDALRVAVSLLESDEKTTRGGPTVSLLMAEPRPFVTGDASMTLPEAWLRMQEAHVHYMPILSRGDVIGLLGEREVLAATRADRAGIDPALLLVADAMSPSLWLVRAERPALSAARILLDRRAGALAVLAHGGLRGLVTAADFLPWLLARL